MTAQMLLWINLVMDAFAAIALGTEPPIRSIVKGAPREQTSLLNQRQVLRQIIGVSLWNLIVILLTFFLSAHASGVGTFPYFADKDQKSPETNSTSKTYCPPPTASFDVSKFSQGKMYTKSKDNDAYVKSLYTKEWAVGTKQYNCKAFRDGYAKKTVFTYVFNVFMFLALFNMINCRKVGISDTNVFEKILTHNWIFLLVLGVCFFAQWALVNWFHDLIGAVKISRSEWGACAFIGATELLAAFFLKFTPSKWVEFIPDINVEDEATESGIVSRFKSATEIDVTQLG